MKKKLLFASCSILSVCALAGFAACGGNEEKKTSYAVTVDSAVNVALEESHTLIAKVDGAAAQGIAFTSANPAIATVNENGTVTGVACGETTVTATYEGYSATATVTVDLGTNVPLLVFDSVSGTDLQVSWMDEINLSASVLYKGKTYDDVTVTYAVDENAATVTNGIFKAKKSGECTVKATATWRNAPVVLSETFTIKAIPSVEISINQGKLDGSTLYLSENLAGETFVKSVAIDCAVKVNGTQTDDYEVVVVEGAENVTLADGVLTAAKVGDSTLRVSVVDPLGTTHSEYVRVAVKKPLSSTVKTAQTPFETLTGAFDTEEIFGYATTIVEAYENGTPLSVVEGKIQGVTVNKDGSNIHRTLTVYDENGGYTVNFEVYTKVIRTAQDLDVFAATTNDIAANKTTAYYNVYDGYYVLAGNIDASAYKTTNKRMEGFYGNSASDKNHAKTGLMGTFDGRGYTITGMTADNGGLFGIVGTAGVIKNVAFKASKIAMSNWRGGGLLAMAIENGAHLENVYVEIASMSTAQSNQGVLAYGVDPKVSMNNVVVEYTSESANVKRALMYRYGDRYGTTTGNAIATNWTNVYAITNQTLVGVANVAAENETIADGGYGYTGIKKYESVDALKASGNDFGVFSTTYWDLSGGVPVWKN